MPRFVVLAHHTTPSSNQQAGFARLALPVHYDLMLEHGEVLATWSFEEPPARHGQACRLIQDHRKAYLDYEGEVSGDRGRVERWEAGTYEGTIGDDRVEAAFAGGKLAGRWELVRVEDGDAWELRRAVC